MTTTTALLTNKSKLSATVKYNKTNKTKCPVVTEVTILAENLVIAWANLGGRYSQIAALKEFKRLPGRFSKNELYTVAVALGLQ